MVCPEAAVTELSIYPGAVPRRNEPSLQETVPVAHPPPVPETIVMEDVAVMDVHQDSIGVDPRPCVINESSSTS